MSFYFTFVLLIIVVFAEAVVVSWISSQPGLDAWYLFAKSSEKKNPLVCAMKVVVINVIIINIMRDNYIGYICKNHSFKAIS